MTSTIRNIDQIIEHQIAELQEETSRLPEWDEIYHSLDDWIKDNKHDVDYAAIRMLPAWYPEYREMEGHSTILGNWAAEGSTWGEIVYAWFNDWLSQRWTNALSDWHRRSVKDANAEFIPPTVPELMVRKLDYGLFKEEFKKRLNETYPGGPTEWRNILKHQASLWDLFEGALAYEQRWDFDLQTGGPASQMAFLWLDQLPSKWSLAWIITESLCFNEIMSALAAHKLVIECITEIENSIIEYGMYGPEQVE